MFILYNIMVFLTGYLILSVQLIFGKSILPVFGGSPNVWLTSLAFYQVVLTLGYLYSYIMQKKVKLRTQVFVHCGLFLASLIFIPISLNTDFTSFSSSESIGFFITTFVSIGIPYFLLTGSSPLLQSWFGHSKLEKSSNPYVLYVSSNLGTFLSLITYPFLIEIYFSSQEQFNLWSILFLIEIVLIILCGFFLYKLSLKDDKEIINIPTQRVKKSLIFYWIMVAFVPSSLLSIFTNKITIDIAPIPLLWIIPLGLYFLSFSIGFSDRFKKFDMFNNISLLSLIVIFFITVTSTKDFYVIFFYLIGLFSVSVTFHNFLYKNSPDKEHLTLFYLFMSVGGACGGLFVGVLSPLIFSGYYEFYFSLFLGCILCLQFSKKEDVEYDLRQNLIYFVPFTLIFLFGVYKANDSFGNVIYQERTFFGVNTIEKREVMFNEEKHVIKLLMHGTTLHGSQIIEPSIKSSIPLTYYSSDNPISMSIQDYDNVYGFKNIGVIGLGTGAMNCSFDNKNVDFFEIDEEILNIAQNEFKYLEVCKNNQNFILGDARIKMKEINDNKYDILVVDAFSSDAIPVHLITKEAIDMYTHKIKDNGFISFHISNRYLNLEPVLGNIAKSLNINSKICKSKKSNEVISSTSSNVVVMGNDLTMLTHECWKPTKYDNEPVWNDNYSNILKYLIF